MKMRNKIFGKYKIAVVSIFSIVAYFLIKSIFWPMQKNITVLIQQQQNDILNLDTPTNSTKEKHLVFDQVNFRKDSELFHDNTGYLHFKHNFFMHISTGIRVLKEANYIFRVASDDGFRLKINDAIVCEHIGGRSFSVTECHYKLIQGKHLLQLNYYQGPDKLGLKLTYQTNNAKEYFVGENSDVMKFHVDDGSFSSNYTASAEENKQLIQHATAGDSYAQYTLAAKYLSGDGIVQDNKQAFKWFKEAAKSGETEAQFHIGQMYNKGIGTHQDIEKALHWLKLSATNFNDDAQYYLGLLYYEGKGVEQNYAEALYWIKKAAMGEGEDNQHPFFVSKKSGHANAQFQLGKMYESGLGVEINHELAKKWILKSNSQADTNINQ